MAKKRFKLDRESLPADRRYSRERFWIQERPDGSVRLGLAVPAIQDEPPGVYFAHLRSSGYIVTGKKFGFVDLDSGRLDLVAPLSGRVSQVNPRLASDPKVIADDPFGEGWLCDLTRVLPEALRSLLDRESFHGWVRFEREARLLGLEPTVGCAQRIVAGEPWPQEIVFRLGGRVVLRSRAVREGRNETFTPQWTLGQRWRVRTRYEQPSMAKILDPKPVRKTLEWDYEVVEEFGEAGGETCWVVRVTEVGGVPAQSYLLLYFARSDFTLRLVEEVSAQDSTSRARTRNDWGAESFMELRRPRELILDHPVFPPENVDERREARVGEEPPISIETRFPSPKVLEAAMEAPAGRGLGTIRSEQRWERGLPWWRAARRLAGDRVLMTGELVAVGDEKVDAGGDAGPGAAPSPN